MSNTQPNVDDELYQRITDICLGNGGVTKPMVDRLYALFTKQLEEAEIRARQQLKVNVFTQFRLAMQKQELSPRPPKGARFRAPLEELSLILEENAPLNELATLTQDTKGGTDDTPRVR